MSQVRAELTDIVSRHKPFRLSFAGRVSGYVNGKKYGGEGEGGRAFLAVRLAAGSMDVCPFSHATLDVGSLIVLC